MINLPFKKIPITDFKLYEVSSLDYTHNSEFEQSFKSQFKDKIRVVEFKMPEDVEVVACRYFRLDTNGIMTFQEFTKHVKNDWTIRFVCHHDNWAEVKKFEFAYFYLTEDLVEIRNELKVLTDKFNKKVIELNEKQPLI